MEPHRRGDLTEAIVFAEFVRREIPIATPFTDNERWDVLAERPDGTVIRIQIKTGRYTDGTVRFQGTSTHTNSRGNVRKRYDGDVDAFVVYCHELGAMYLVPESAFETRMRLRVEEPEMSMETINWATEFEFDERWPPDPRDETPTDELPASTGEVLEALESTGYPVWRPVGAGNTRIVVTEVDGRRYRGRIETGYLTDGRIRVFPEGMESDFFLVHCPDLDPVYAVAAEDVAETFSLRVDEPSQHQPDTKLASDYELARNWPPV